MTDRKISRRDWLKGLGAAGLGSLALGPMVGTPAAEAMLAKGSGGEGKVPTRPFGKTGVEVSSLALGGMFDIPNNQLLLKQALTWGVTYWDTADCYGGGKSEKGMGKFFSKRRPEVRKEIFLVSKSDARDPDGITDLLDQSLERLKTDYIDLYFIHGIRHIDELDDKTKKWAEKAKADGKIRFFGFSTHKNMEACLMEGAKLGWIDGIMMTYNFRLMHTDEMQAAVKACVDAGIGLTAMKTQGGGVVRTESEAELQLAGRFVKRGFTDKQAKLKAVWEDRKIASICSQMPSLTILMSNVAAALDKTELSASDMTLLNNYAKETESTYCTGCAQLCESTFREDIPIADIMRSMMYHHHYMPDDDLSHGLETLPEGLCRRLLEADFSKAERKCPQNLAIGRVIREAVEVLG